MALWRSRRNATIRLTTGLKAADLPTGNPIRTRRSKMLISLILTSGSANSDFLDKLRQKWSALGWCGGSSYTSRSIRLEWSEWDTGTSNLSLCLADIGIPEGGNADLVEIRVEVGSHSFGQEASYAFPYSQIRAEVGEEGAFSRLVLTWVTWEGYLAGLEGLQKMVPLFLGKLQIQHLIAQAKIQIKVVLGKLDKAIQSVSWELR